MPHNQRVIMARDEMFTSKTISELACFYDVSLRTLRFYEEVGLLEPIRAGSARLYSQKDETRLKLILTGKRIGFSLQEIRKLIDSANRPENSKSENICEVLSKRQIEAQLEALKKRKNEVEAAIAELEGVI